MTSVKTDYSDLKAVYINCSIKKDNTKSHTQLLMNKSAKIMEAQGVNVEHVYVLDHTIAFGMIKDGAEGPSRRMANDSKKDS